MLTQLVTGLLVFLALLWLAFSLLTFRTYEALKRGLHRAIIISIAATVIVITLIIINAYGIIN